MTGRPETASLFARAESLEAERRDEDAKAAYLAVLAQDPAHFGALINLGRLVHALELRGQFTFLLSRAMMSYGPHRSSRRP